MVVPRVNGSPFAYAAIRDRRRVPRMATRDASVQDPVGDALADGRAAYAREAWADAFAQLSRRLTAHTRSASTTSSWPRRPRPWSAGTRRRSISRPGPTPRRSGSATSTVPRAAPSGSGSGCSPAANPSGAVAGWRARHAMRTRPVPTRWCTATCWCPHAWVTTKVGNFDAAASAFRESARIAGPLADVDLAAFARLGQGAR